MLDEDQGQQRIPWWATCMIAGRHVHVGTQNIEHWLTDGKTMVVGKDSQAIEALT